MDRDGSRDRGLGAKHQHSFSDASSRLPMWDSSDPDRAPPPLPLNPHPSSPSTTRANTSSTIAAAAKALEDKARESLPASAQGAYTTNRMESPDRSLIRGAHHKRMQTLPHNSVRDLRSFLDSTAQGSSSNNNTRSPERSRERSRERTATTPTPGSRGVEHDRDYLSPTSPDKSATSPTRHGTPTPAGRDMYPRPSTRSAHKAILGEHTPPSATMLALQTMPVRDFNEPLFGATHSGANGASSPSKESSNNSNNTNNNANTTSNPTPHTIDAISAQILSLTTIATSLQKEMSQLSRRSKDNATDLITLKEATNSRDEDIRNTLRELVASVNASITSASHNVSSMLNNAGATGANGGISRANSGLSAGGAGQAGSGAAAGQGGASTPQSQAKSFSLPRIPSPASFSLLDERLCGSPSPFSVEGAASVAMLEKIIREMVTKDGQERLLSQLSQLFEKASRESGETAKETARKVSQLVDFMKDGAAVSAAAAGVAGAARAAQSSSALVRHRGESLADGGGAAPPGANGAPHSSSASSSSSGPIARTSREMNPPLSVFSTSGDSQKPYSSPKAADFVSADMLKLLRKIKDSVTESGGMTAEVKAMIRDLRAETLGMGRDLGRKVDEFLAARNGGNSHLAIEDGVESRTKEDLTRIVHEGVAELKNHMDRVIREKRRQSGSSTIISKSSVDNDEVYRVVKHALAERGLDRDMVDDSNTRAVAAPGLDRDSILNAVREAYEAYKPDIEVQQFGLERDEILDCLREGLEDYRTNHGAATTDNQPVSREEIMEAVQEAMQNFRPPQLMAEAQEIREEMLAAFRECLDDFKFPTQSQNAVAIHGDEINKNDIIEAVREGLALYAPNVTDREIDINRDDLFEAVRAGLEGSNTPFGSYGERVVNQLHGLVEQMREGFKDYSSASGRDSEQILDAMKDGLESLRTSVESYVDRAQDVTGKDEILESIRTGLESLRSDLESVVTDGLKSGGDGHKELLDYIKSEFEHLHESMGSMGSQVGPVSTSTQDKEEILAALDSAFDDIKQNMGTKSLVDDSNEDLEEAMKEEFEQLRKDVLEGTASQKGEILVAIEEGMDSILSRLDGKGPANVSTEDALNEMREELAHLRSTIASTMVREGSEGSTEIMESIRESLEALRGHIASDQGATAKEMMDSVQQELEKLRDGLGSSVVRGGGSSQLDKEELIETLRSTLDDMKSEASRSSVDSGINEEVLEAIRGEFETLRHTLAASVANRNNNHADMEEMHDTLRVGLDDVRSAVDKGISRLDNPDRQMSADGVLLDAINEGVDSLKSAIKEAAKEPIENDVTIQYEILDTLKTNMATLQADIDSLKGRKPLNEEGGAVLSGNEVVLAEDGESLAREAPGAVQENALNRNDLKDMEVLLAQLQIKVEAMDANIQNGPTSAPPPTEPAPGSVLKEDLTSIEEILKNLQDAVADVAAKERASTEDVAKKEDTDAIETLLRNTKAKLDEMTFPDPTTVPTKDQIDTVEAVVKSTNEVLDGLASRIDEKAATKMDVAVVETLVGDVKTAIEELKTAAPSDDENKPVTKTDVEVLFDMYAEIKTKFDDLVPRTDIDALSGLILDFREGFDKQKDKYDEDVKEAGVAMEQRRIESETIVESMSHVKRMIDEVKDEIKEKMEESGASVFGLGDTIKSLEDTIGSNFNITADVKELMETVNREFERANGSIEGLKADQDERTSGILEKHEEIKAALFEQIVQKLDERFDTIMSKYDDAQAAAETQAKTVEEKTSEQTEILSGTKSMAEELKVTIDTLGTSIMELGTTFNESTDKMSGDSKTVFERIGETFGKLDKIEGTVDTISGFIDKVDQHRGESKAEHDQIRDEVAKAVDILNSLQGETSEHNPKVIMALRELQAVVNQHFEQSQQAQETAAEQARAVLEDAKARTEEIKDSFSALPNLLPPPPPAPEPIEKYDDSAVKEKLEQIMETISDSAKATAQMERLEQIHQQVVATASEVSQFIANQQKMILEEHENKEKEAEELSLLIERRHTQKEQLDLEIHGLNGEKESLQAVVEALRAEKDALAEEKRRYSADISSMRTAVEIRREELHMMDSKAHALEQRIMEGFVNQSRLAAQRKAKTPKAKKPQRAPSNASHSTVSSLQPNSNPLAMALKTRPTVQRSNATANPAARRIFSLNQISSNVPNGAQGYNSATSSSLSSMRRSNSVKSQNGARKPSWHSRRSLSTLDKENTLDEEASEGEASEHGGESDAGTERRFSIQTGTATESNLQYGPESLDESVATESVTDDRATDRRTSYTGESELTYSTGSYITGSDVTGADRRTSYGSTVRSTLGGLDGTIEEEEVSDPDETAEDHHEDAEPGGGEEEEHTPNAKERRPQESEGKTDPDEVGHKEIVVYDAPSDSGLGSEIPTAAALSGSEADYFRKGGEQSVGT
ncbi:hypothetical protein BDY21DRAFT_72596 [Lineolata rhizophorae]|uniref:Transport protein USO1 n=1 Tax=Lineolata rhizophorae TaxID=578093 RepID=A0A6A6NU36_9PEZI|nr:hypothetical protein BDY21DRAFT_72596 [Lineolata rhizophorae]